MRLVLTATVCLATLAGAGGRAEETAAGEPAPAEGSISSAKRDFDAIKASRDAALQQKGGMSGLTTPEIPGSVTASPWSAPATKNGRPAEKQAKSANWLLDAMDREKKQEKADALRPERDRRESVDLRGSERSRSNDFLEGEKAADELAPGARETELKEQGEKRSPPPAINPLTRYMGDWMTPQDFALLKSNLGNGAAKDAFMPGGSLPGSGSAPAADLMNSAGGIDAALGGFGSTRAAAPMAPPRENPFLAGVASVGAPPATALPPPMLSMGPPPGVPTILVAPSPAPAPARSNIPDFAKPSDNEKYFKPLKRF